MDINNFQRLGAPSNTRVGSDFEGLVCDFFAQQGITLTRSFAVPVGVGQRKKPRKFDLGGDTPPILVECKSHAWTAGGNVPSAKITVWNEAMYYFHLAPTSYRKVLFALKSVRQDVSLAAYYVRCHNHLIPENVEIWEYDAVSASAARVY